MLRQAAELINDLRRVVPVVYGQVVTCGAMLRPPCKRHSPGRFRGKLSEGVTHGAQVFTIPWNAVHVARQVARAWQFSAFRRPGIADSTASVGLDMPGAPLSEGWNFLRVPPVNAQGNRMTRGGAAGRLKLWIRPVFPTGQPPPDRPVSLSPRSFGDRVS